MASEQIASTLFANLVTTLRNTPPPFNTDLGATLASIALDACREYGLAFLSGQGPWDRVLVDVVTQVIDGLQAALEHPDAHAIAHLLSRQHLLELARIFLIRAVQTPGMLAGDQPELQAIVRGVPR